MPTNLTPYDVRLGARAGRAVRDLPISAKIIAALAVVLWPLGLFAVLAAFRSYTTLSSTQVLTTAQMLTITLPLLMWVAALVTVWWVSRTLVVRPLMEMQHAVRRYSAGDTSVRLSQGRYVSREMDDFAETFDTMADDIGQREETMRALLIEQTRLTREVHHRVKNNLQIVASLLSIQSRSAPTPDVAAAYAAIQARVGALALVHRWMYGDEGVRGVDVRALLTDLCASLEQSLAAISNSPVHLSANIERALIGEDTAVPIAFLTTELLSAAARLTAPAPLSAKVCVVANACSVTLTVVAPAFAGPDLLAPGQADPAARIIIGMARQLRSPIRHDPAAQSYAIDIALPAPQTVAGQSAPNATAQ